MLKCRAKTSQFSKNISNVLLIGYRKMGAVPIHGVLTTICNYIQLIGSIKLNFYSTLLFLYFCFKAIFVVNQILLYLFCCTYTTYTTVTGFIRCRNKQICADIDAIYLKN